MRLDPEYLDFLMLAALREAEKAAQSGEVPVGAVLARDEKIIAAAHNLVEACRDVTAHAECLVIREASRLAANWRLSGCILCVTLEPCAMCLTAIRLARIPVVVFGARDAVMGAAGSTLDLCAEGGSPRVLSGIREDECASLLRDFFRIQRKEVRES